MPEHKHINLRQVGAVTVVGFRDDKLVEQGLVSDVREELSQLVETEKPKNLLLSFAGVRLMSSTALAAVLSLTRRMKAHDGKLKLCEMAPMVYEIFAITELNKLFDIRDDETAGLRAFAE